MITHDLSLLAFYLQSIHLNSYIILKNFWINWNQEVGKTGISGRRIKLLRYFWKTLCGLLIDFSENSENGSTCKPLKKPKTWKDASSKFINEIRFQHLAYSTEKTYRSWIKRFIEFCNNAPPEEIRSSHVKKLVLLLIRAAKFKRTIWPLLS
ncbi:MAG: phage integrase N-terminal SAM-like domain-containing protein [Deltaproteobacteria bacterium]|nr:phage integrase N-terminal SAM-like domain-containing protein [Deltaproteobacteria bacterium]